MGRCASLLLAAGSMLVFSVAAIAEDLEPRRWTHTPIGLDSLSVGYVYTRADILLDPVSRLQDVDLRMHAWGLKYLHTFELLDKTARVEATQGYAVGRWTGLVDGVQRSAERDGLADTQLRFAVNLVGAPLLAGKAFQEYRAQPGVETIVGAGVVVDLPTGEYMSDKLINIGSNRFTIRPQLGVLHNWDDWSLEYTGSVWFYTDNNDYYNDSTLRQNPLYSIQAHVVRTIARGTWIGLSGAYTYGADSVLNGNALHDTREQVMWSLGFGFPLSQHLLGKFAYVGNRALETIGVDSDSFAVGVGYLW
ncbi:MAG TPA: transporter [Planctomycetota bacterium]|nr:transporter [Planctomycetota bacterium]